MRNKIGYLLYGLKYLFETKILKQEIPFIGGLVINEKCNLKCTHCRVANRDMLDLTYDEAAKGLETFYGMGIRTVFIEGGEPFLWRNNEYQLEDVIRLGRRIGFKVISIYTNGTFPIKTSADVVFVSLDGLEKTNNALRGHTYDKVLGNIKNSNHPNVNINFTINRKNQQEIETFCEEMQRIRQVRGIFFYFHTPYYGIDDLFLNINERKRIIEELLILKRRRFKILNSSGCLKAVLNDNWERPSKICYIFANNKLYQCCRAIGMPEVCANCGYLGYPEIIHILKLYPSSIIAALNYLPLNKKESRHLI